MLKFTRSVIQTAKCTHLRVYLSSAPTAELKNATSEPLEGVVKRKGGGIVAAAFASLREAQVNEIRTPITDQRIISATSIDELLSISSGSGVSRRHALKVVSVLAEWSSKGKVRLNEFETDPRFIKLCRVLSKTSPKTNARTVEVRNDDLSTILGITADDEAARLVSSITVPQMVKVMSNLSAKKRRSIVLLRSLAFNIAKSPETLDLKQCGDLLYAMAVLNFPDENLLEKVLRDVPKGINDDINKSSVLGSIVTSLGLLKYKHSHTLDCICNWMVKHSNGCRPQDVFALFLTLGVLNYEPQNSEELYKVLMVPITQSDTIRFSIWLDFVWSLVLLDKPKIEHLSSVLDKKFINRLQSEKSLTVVNKLKLLNIDSYAEYFSPGFKGPKLSESLDLKTIVVPRNKDKEDLCQSVIDCLKNLGSEKCFKIKVNTEKGFYIDVECALDEKCNLIPLDRDIKDKQKVAILIHQYQDMCKCIIEPTGLSNFSKRILKKMGYKVITIPYTEYRPKDKLMERVKYLRSKLSSVGEER